MKRIIGIIVLLLMGLIVGCASVPMASVDQDAKAKQFVPDPTKASLYVYRNDVMAGAIPISIDLNGQKIGEVVSKSYLQLKLTPGVYVIGSHSKNEDGLSKSNDSSLSVSVEAGKNYYVHLNVGVGVLFASSSLETVDMVTGMEGVNASSLTLASTTDYGVTPKNGSAAANPEAVDSNGVPYPSIIFGQSGVVVEKMAMKRNCKPISGATLFYSNGPIEDYRVKCMDGSEVAAHCEYRQCVMN